MYALFPPGSNKVAQQFMTFVLYYMQAFSDTASSRRHSLDLHELMKSSIPSWPRQTLDTNEEDREFKSGEWIDKHTELNQDDNLLSPDKFYQSINPQQLYVTYIPLSQKPFSYFISFYLDLIVDL